MRVFTEIFVGVYQDLFPEDLSERLDVSLGPVIEELMTEFSDCANPPEDVHVSLSLLEEDGIRELNRTFRGEDAATDVLAFPLHAGIGGFVIPGDIPMLLLGDIVVSPSRVKANAASSRHSFEREFSLVIIHGLLHLFGMDHDTKERKETMLRSQERYWDTIEQALSSQKDGREGDS